MRIHPLALQVSRTFHPRATARRDRCTRAAVARPPSSRRRHKRTTGRASLQRCGPSRSQNTRGTKGDSMRSSVELACCAFLGCVLVSPAVRGQPPAGLYLAEFQDGSVVEILGGGNVSTKPRFATGLLEPAGMCLGPNDDLYVVEFAGNSVMIITAGGDFSAVTPFATGLAEPLDLVCTATQILVNEYAS